MRDGEKHHKLCDMCCGVCTCTLHHRLDNTLRDLNTQPQPVAVGGGPAVLSTAEGMSAALLQFIGILVGVGIAIRFGIGIHLGF